MNFLLRTFNSVFTFEEYMQDMKISKKTHYNYEVAIYEGGMTASIYWMELNIIVLMILLDKVVQKCICET